MAEEAKDFGAIGEEILFAARNELYMNLPYLDVALCGLRFAPGDEVTRSIATDGQTLYYSGSWLAERYLRSRVLTNRAYLHVILHCMLRHLAKKRGKAAELWDLACDVAVESILSELDYPCLDEGTVPMKQKFFGECRQEMPVLTAEGIYRYLLRRDLGEYELAQLQRRFLVDDHGLWDQQQEEQNQKQDQQWKDRSEKTRTGMETVTAGQSTGGEAVLEQIQVATRDDVDYRAFLRRFAVPRTPALRQHAPGGAAGDQGGKADRGLRHRRGYLHVHLRCAGAPVFGLHLRHFAQHRHLYAEGEHPDHPVR